MEDFRIENGRRVRFYVLDEGTNQVLGLSAAGANKDSIASVNMAKDPFLGDEFFREPCLPRVDTFETHWGLPFAEYHIRFACKIETNRANDNELRE
jgi:hypothetical protein